jgi:hypothetical protein
VNVTVKFIRKALYFQQTKSRFFSRVRAREAGVGERESEGEREKWEQKLKMLGPIS